jgi:type VI secretion system protein ImpB
LAEELMAKSGQRFIKENRAPRVHIEYEVETFGSMQKVSLPFVMGVMSDLSGKSLVEKKSMADRDFVEFDMDNFDQRMAAMAPRAAFNVDLTFKNMEDFSPGAIAKKVPALAQLLEARQQLNDLMLYMDGKDGAQDLLDKLLKDPDLMKAMAAARPQPEAQADEGEPGA